MTLSGVAVLFHLAVAQVPVVVTYNDKARTPVPDATVSVMRGTALLDRAITNPNGIATLRRDTSGYTSADFIEVLKAPLDTQVRDWPEDFRGDEPITIRMPTPRKMCTKTIRRFVPEQNADGSIEYKPVYETKVVPCPPAQAIQYPLPAIPPPHGYRYRLIYVKKWYDAESGAEMHQPFYVVESIWHSAQTMSDGCGCD